MFWVDLTTANGLNLNLIEGGFSSASINGGIPGVTSTTLLDEWYPSAKLGGGNYIYVFSGGWTMSSFRSPATNDGANYFCICVPDVQYNSQHVDDTNSFPGISARVAYLIDSKVDDGYPQSGRVLTILLGDNAVKWAGDAEPGTIGPVTAGDGVATQGTTNTCYDNDNVAGATEHYSLEINSGAGLNCALSFRMQGGD